MTDMTAPDTFAAVAGLVALIVDPKASGKRLSEFKAIEDRITSAQTKLDGERAEHDQAVATATREMDEREARLRKREVAAMILENELRPREAALRASMPPRYPFDPNMGPGSMGPGGITREEYSDG